MWVSWCMYFLLSLYQMPLILKVQCLIAAEGFDWLYLVFFHIDPLLFWRWFIYFFLYVLLSLSRHLEVCFTVWKKEMEEMPQFSVVEFPTNSPLGWKGAEMGFWSLQCKAAPIPPLTWLESGSYSFLFLNSLLAEKCSFEWTEII